MVVISALLLNLYIFKDDRVAVVYHQSQWNAFAPEVDRAFKAGSSIKAIKMRHVYGMVVPHHIPTTIPNLVETYSRLKKTQDVKNFIVVGPDHTDAGKATATVSNASFFTTFGELRPIDGLAKKLDGLKLASIEEDPFKLEHSIGAQTLVIGKIFPNARITPIIIRSNMSKGQAEALGNYLSTLLNDETILVASVDFSHFLSSSRAEPIDRLSGEIVSKLDIENIELMEADSTKSMEIFMRAMIKRGAIDTDSVVVLNTNDFMQNQDYTTGYVFGYWGKKR